jgi:hypothetical protein
MHHAMHFLLTGRSANLDPHHVKRCAAEIRGRAAFFEHTSRHLVLCAPNANVSPPLLAGCELRLEYVLNCSEIVLKAKNTFKKCQGSTKIWFPECGQLGVLQLS